GGAVLGTAVGVEQLLTHGGASPAVPGVARSSSRQPSQGPAQHVRGVPVVGEVGQRGADLLGCVAEADQRLPHVRERAARRGRPVAARRPRGAAADRDAVGHVEAGPQLDQQAGGRLLPHARHEAEGGHVLLGQDAGQGRRAVDGQDGERQRRADAVRAEQGLEGGLLVAGGEPVEHLRVLAHVVVDPDEHLVARLAERGRRRRRGHHLVADAADLDEHPVGAPVQQAPAQRPDHRATPGRAPPTAAAAAARPLSGTWARWHSASATASAASTGRSGRSMPSSVCTMRSTCTLSAPPWPATACLTWLGEYSTTAAPAETASTMATPAAWATGMAVRTFTWNRTRSTATT